MSTAWGAEGGGGGVLRFGVGAGAEGAGVGAGAGWVGLGARAGTGWVLRGGAEEGRAGGRC